MIELLIDRVVVTNDEVEIRYVIPTSPSSERFRFCQLRLDYFREPALVKPGSFVEEKRGTETLLGFYH